VGSGALVSLLSSTRQTIAQSTTRPPPTDTKSVPTDPFILLLRGVYTPVTDGDLGLSSINLADGTYSRTKIYPVFGVPSAEDGNEQSNNVQTTPIGYFYAPLANSNNNLCAYQLPGGAIAMEFSNNTGPPGFNGFVNHDDGHGGIFMQGTFELSITEATGIYAGFLNGANYMVDRLHQLPNGRLDEFCFCNISKYPFP
jgi:hypothetical protein